MEQSGEVNKKADTKVASGNKMKVMMGCSYYPADVVHEWIRKHFLSMDSGGHPVIAISKNNDVGYIGFDKRHVLDGLAAGLLATGIAVSVLDFSFKNGMYKIYHLPVGYEKMTTGKS